MLGKRSSHDWPKVDVESLISILDSGRYQSERYSGLVKPDFSTRAPKMDFCLSMCAVNSTCAAVLYNESTSICHMSGEPEVQDISGAVPNAFVKLEQTVVILAPKGLCHHIIILSWIPTNICNFV